MKKDRFSLYRVQVDIIAIITSIMWMNVSRCAEFSPGQSNNAVVGAWDGMTMSKERLFSNPAIESTTGGENGGPVFGPSNFPALTSHSVRQPFDPATVGGTNGGPIFTPGLR